MEEGVPSRSGAEARPATWGDRASAFVLDILLLIPLWLVAVLAADVSPAVGDLLGWGIVILWVYGRVLDSVGGASPAKRLMGLRVVDAETGERLPLGRALARWIFGLIFIVILGPINYIIVPLVSRKHQTMHDMIGSAVVLRAPESRVKPGMALWAWSPAAVSETEVRHPDGNVDALSGVIPVPRVWRSRRTVLIVAGVIAVLILADWYLRNREMNNLLDAVEQSETAMEDARDHVTAAESDFVNAMQTHGCSADTVTYECQQYFNQEASVFRSAASGAATDGAVEVRQTGAGVDHVSILPWHGALEDARSAYVDHSDAWYSYLTAVADDPAKLGDRSDSADISSTFGIAEDRFLDAVPPMPLFDAKDRITKIWAD